MRKDPEYQNGRLVHSVWKNNKKQLRKEKRKADQQLQQRLQEQQQWQEHYIVNEDDLVDCDN